MDNYTVWSGSRVQLLGERGDENATSQSLFAYNDTDEFEVLNVPFVLVDGVYYADLSYTAPLVTEETVYEYYITENFDDEDPIIYPSPENCGSGGCDLPTITVCPIGNDNSESS